MSNTVSDYQMNRSAFTVAALGDEPDERDYWATKTPEERLAALEFMRQVMYGYDPTTVRLQRVLEVAELSRS